MTWPFRAWAKPSALDPLEPLAGKPVVALLLCLAANRSVGAVVFTAKIAI